MKTNELREKSIEQLQTERLSLSKAQFGLRMQKATNQLTNSSELKKIRRNIARINTILAQKDKS